MDKEQKLIRLQVFLAKCGVGSRRKCEKLIEDGSVTVNGKVIKTQGYKVYGTERICYKGRQVQPETKRVYFALNKPSRYICSVEDPQGRRCAIDLMKDATNLRIYNVGRLDFLSSGIIFFTNDGDFAQAVMHPSHEIDKEYIVDTQKTIDEEILKRFKEGVQIEGQEYIIQRYKYRTPNSVRITLTEGKNREIRKLFDSQNLQVRKLHRVRIGPVTVKGIPKGGWRPLSKQEIAFFL